MATASLPIPCPPSAFRGSGCRTWRERSRPCGHGRCRHALASPWPPPLSQPPPFPRCGQTTASKHSDSPLLPSILRPWQSPGPQSRPSQPRAPTVVAAGCPAAIVAAAGPWPPAPSARPSPCGCGCRPRRRHRHPVSALPRPAEPPTRSVPVCLSPSACFPSPAPKPPLLEEMAA